MLYFPKSTPAPECLTVEKDKINGDYKCGHVLNRLSTDFKEKCYICEDKTATSINVEHFIPHKEDKALKFSWLNLFYACGHCNNIKLAQYTDLLNCTTDQNIESKIRYEIKSFPKEVPKIIAIDNSAQTVRTVELLVDVYNGRTPIKKLESAKLRKKLLHEIKIFGELLNTYFDYADADAHQEKLETLSRIKLHLHSSTSFASFKRWIIRDNEALLQEFGEHISN